MKNAKTYLYLFLTQALFLANCSDQIGQKRASAEASAAQEGSLETEEANLFSRYEDFDNSSTFDDESPIDNTTSNTYSQEQNTYLATAQEPASNSCGDLSQALWTYNDAISKLSEQYTATQKAMEDQAAAMNYYAQLYVQYPEGGHEHGYYRCHHFYHGVTYYYYHEALHNIAYALNGQEAITGFRDLPQNPHEYERRKQKYLFHGEAKNTSYGWAQYFLELGNQHIANGDDQTGWWTHCSHWYWMMEYYKHKLIEKDEYDVAEGRAATTGYYQASAQTQEAMNNGGCQ